MAPRAPVPGNRRVKDGREWEIGSDAEVAWVRNGTVPGSAVTSAVPPVFAAYCTLLLPESVEGAQRRHDHAVVRVLRDHSTQQQWWLGYLEVGIGADVVFVDAPRVKLYEDWNYVVVLAGPTQAATWRLSEGRGAPWKGALPDLMFPPDRSWLFATRWDDHWSCIGGSEELVASFKADSELGSRTRVVGASDVLNPEGSTAR
jgi:hypothetical protein